MSRTALIVMLALAVVLCGAAYLLLRPEPAAVAGDGRVLQFLPSEVTEIVIARPDGAVQRLIRSRDASQWAMIRPSRPTVPELWPVAPEHVRSLLRLLADLTGEPASSAEGDDTPQAKVTLKREAVVGTAADVEFTVSEVRLSGRVVLETAHDGQPAGAFWVNGDVGAMLAPEGVMAWRDRTLLRGVGPGVSRVELTGFGGAVTLARQQGRWGVTQPVAAAATQESVERLVSALAGLRAVDLDDQTQWALEGAKAVLTSTTRDADGRARETQQMLMLEPGADLTGRRMRFTVVDGFTTREGVEAAVQFSGRVDAERLVALTTDPVAYIDRRGAVFPAADVGGVAFGARAFRRTTRGWLELGVGAEDTPLPSADGEALSALGTLVTERAADSVMLEAPEGGGAAEWRELELRSLGGDPLAMLEIGIDPGAEGKGPSVVLRDGGVWRVYAAPEGVEAVRGVFGLLDR